MRSMKNKSIGIVIQQDIKNFNFSPFDTDQRNYFTNKKNFLEGQSHEIFVTGFFTYQLLLVPLEMAYGHFDFF